MTIMTSPEVIAPASAQLQLAALLEHTGLAPLSDIGWIRVTGEDRVRWLNGMTTNSIQALKPGESNYNFFLSAQGRIQADAVALMLENCILLGTARTRLPALIELLDRFIIMDDVELAEHSSFGILIAGPHAAQTIATIGISTSDLAPNNFTATNDWRGHKVAILHAHSPLVPRFELWSESPETIAQLTAALATAAAVLVNEEALTHLRILEGTPLYGTDIRDKELPQETAPSGIQSRALHFAKGCYLGQEIVERIRSRGNVHRTFHAFELTGDLPTPGTILEFEGKPVGELTTIATIPLATGPIHLALGFIRREALELSKSRSAAIAGAPPITFPGGTAQPVTTPGRGSLKASSRPKQRKVSPSAVEWRAPAFRLCPGAGFPPIDFDGWERKLSINYSLCPSSSATPHQRENKMPDQNKPFVVTDRRKFTLDGEPRPDADPSPEKVRPTVPPRRTGHRIQRPRRLPGFNRQPHNSRQGSRPTASGR